LQTFPGFEGYLDLEMGPAGEMGIRTVNVVGSSPFLSLDLSPGLKLCLRPILPAMSAGLIDCDGGSNFGVQTTQDHNLGLSGAACLAAGGTLEGKDLPHPNVCNGPIVTAASNVPDSGAGAMLIAPDPQRGIEGLRVEFSTQSGACSPGGPEEVFAFTTASYRAQIDDTDNVPFSMLVHEEQGQNFSCDQFTQQNGPGRLVFTLGALHGAGNDLILVFVLDD
jgi:hypothetical protein